MLRTDDGHRWEPTLYMPMSSSYARTLYDDGAMLMTGDTRPAEFGCTKTGDEVHVKRSGFGVDIDTDSIPLDQIDARLMEPWHLPHQGHRPNDDEREHEIAAARMAGAGMQEPSAPMPLAWTPHRVGDVLGSVVGWGIVTALAVGAWALLLSGVAR